MKFVILSVLVFMKCASLFFPVTKISFDIDSCPLIVRTSLIHHQKAVFLMLPRVSGLVILYIVDCRMDFYVFLLYH